MMNLPTGVKAGIAVLIGAVLTVVAMGVVVVIDVILKVQN